MNDDAQCDAYTKKKKRNFIYVCLGWDDHRKLYKSNNRQFNCRHNIKAEIKVIILYVSVDVSRCSYVCSPLSLYEMHHQRKLREKKVNKIIFAHRKTTRRNEREFFIICE